MKQLRILILGGTGFIGPHFVRAALANGHHVSVFSRGIRNSELPNEVERLVGDRDRDLTSITDRDWDAVIDLATYGPSWVRSLGVALKARVKHYTFVSSNGVYDEAHAKAPITEDSPLKRYRSSDDPYSVTAPEGLEQYQALKVLCEQEAERQFPGRTLILRPTLIFGPGGFSLSLFWMDRIEHGGEMLAAGDPSMPVQFIDVRDIAEWVIRMIEEDGVGTYNVMAPASPISITDMTETMSQILAKSPYITWVSHPWLAQRNEGGIWSPIIFWAETLKGLMSMSAQRALSRGLTFRPMRVTLADSFSWHKAQPAEARAQVFLGAKQPNGSKMTWPVYLEREKQTLADWHARQPR